MMRNKIFKGVMLGAVFLLLFAAYSTYRDFQIKSQIYKELEINGLFINILNSGGTVKLDSRLSGNRLKSIEIKIPSIASKNDDSKNPKKVKEVNKIIDREKLDEGMKKWLQDAFNEKVAKKYTRKITVWYRDERIIDEVYNK